MELDATACGDARVQHLLVQGRLKPVATGDGPSGRQDRAAGSDELPTMDKTFPPFFYLFEGVLHPGSHRRRREQGTSNTSTCEQTLLVWRELLQLRLDHLSYTLRNSRGDFPGRRGQFPLPIRLAFSSICVRLTRGGLPMITTLPPSGALRNEKTAIRKGTK